MPLIRIIGRDNGAGLSRDLALLAAVLRGTGQHVEVVAFGGEKGVNLARQVGLRCTRLWRGRADVQIFPERVYARLLDLGRRNLLIPNPEWFLPKWTPLLPAFERVLCKTRHAQQIFNALGCATSVIGFTSDDRLDADVPREQAFFHGAGRSSAKGTQLLMDAWRRHPEWPRLTVTQHAHHARRGTHADNIDHRIGYLTESGLRQVQNAHVYHVCPSEMEGFGHVLMEAMSVGAITLTTDGEPMNELVQPDRGVLIPPVRHDRQYLSPRYFVDIAGIETAVESAITLCEPARIDMARAARQSFESASAQFRTRLIEAVAG